MQRILKHKRRSLALTLLAFVAVVVAGVYLAVRVSGVTSPEVARSLPMPQQLKPDDFWPDKDGVLHIVYPRTAGYVDKGEPGEGEIWFDPKNMSGRDELRWADGTIESLTVTRGDYYDEYALGGGNRTDPANVENRRMLNGGGWAYWLNGPGQIVAYSGRIEAGQLKATDTTVNNVPALEVQLPVIGEDGKQSSTETVYLDKETRLPIRTEETDTNGNKTGGDTQYSVVEWVPRESVNPKLFELPADLPNVTSRTSETEMTVDEARKFKDFDVYFMGDSFQGQPLYQLLDYNEQAPTSGTSIHYFQAEYYAENAKTDTRVFVTSLAEDKSRQDPWNTPNSQSTGPKRDVTVGGRNAYLYSSRSTADLWQQIGGCVVHVSGSSEEPVLEAGAALVKVNQ